MKACLINTGLALRQRYEERYTLMLGLALSLVFGALVTLVMAGGAQPQGKLLVVDQDQSFVSEWLRAGFAQGPLGDMLSVALEADESRARSTVRDAQVSAVLIIPQGFGEGLLDGRDTELQLITNPAQRILPGIIEESLAMLVEAEHYLRQLMGPELDAIVAQARGHQPPDQVMVAELSVRISERITSLESWLLPPRLDVRVVESSEQPSEATELSAALFFPSILVMALLFLCQLLAGGLWREVESGTLRRMAITPSGSASWVPSQALAALPLLLAAALLIGALGFAWHGWALWQLPVVVVGAVLASLPLFALMLLLSSLAPSRRGADVLTTVVLLPMLMLGGSFFPLAAMPDWLSGIGQWLPNGILARALSDWLLMEGQVLDWWVTVAALALGGFSLLLLVQWRLPVLARRAVS